MKRNHKKIFLINLLFLLSLFVACNKNAVIDNAIIDENYISISEAKNVGLTFINYNLISSKKKLSSNKNTSKVNFNSIKSVYEFKGKSNLNVFYIINFNENGFAIVSADKRTQKILAYSDNNSFNTDTVPSGLGEWMYARMNYIDEIRLRNVKYIGQDKVGIYNAALVNSFGGNKTKVLPPDDPPTDCEPSYSYVNPLLQTTWAQSVGYNNYMPLKSCVSSQNNGRASTGCVATAMAQVVRFDQYPSTYNYSIMPDIYESNIFSAGNNEMSRLINNLSVALNSDYTNSNCDLTTADTEDVPSVLINYLGYSNSATYIEPINHNLIINELTLGRPVILEEGEMQVG